MVKVSYVNGELMFTYKLESGEEVSFDYDGSKAFMKRIEKGEVKIQSMEL